MVFIVLSTAAHVLASFFFIANLFLFLFSFGILYSFIKRQGSLPKVLRNSFSESVQGGPILIPPY